MNWTLLQPEHWFTDTQFTYTSFLNTCRFYTFKFSSSHFIAFTHRLQGLNQKLENFKNLNFFDMLILCNIKRKEIKQANETLIKRANRVARFTRSGNDLKSVLFVERSHDKSACWNRETVIVFVKKILEFNNTIGPLSYIYTGMDLLTHNIRQKHISCSAYLKRNIICCNACRIIL